MCTCPWRVAASDVFAVWNQITISRLRRSLFLRRVSSDWGAAGALGQDEVTENYEQCGQNTSALSDWLAASLLEAKSTFLPECLVYVFLTDKKQTISIKEDEAVQLLLLVLSLFSSTQPGSFLHLISSSSLWPFWFSADFSRKGSGQVWRGETCVTGFVTREDSGQLRSAEVSCGWVGGVLSQCGLTCWNWADGASLITW